MNKTIELLEEKNLFLEKFLGLNIDWLEKLSRGDFTDLEHHREERESILNILKHIDGLIETETLGFNDTEIDLQIKNRVNQLLSRKDSLVKAILAQDLDIMNLVEKEKSNLILELQKAQKGRKTISSYKSFKRKEIIDEEV